MIFYIADEAVKEKILSRYYRYVGNGLYSVNHNKYFFERDYEILSLLRCFLDKIDLVYAIRLLKYGHRHKTDFGYAPPLAEKYIAKHVENNGSNALSYVLLAFCYILQNKNLDDIDEFLKRAKTFPDYIKDIYPKISYENQEHISTTNPHNLYKFYTLESNVDIILDKIIHKINFLVDTDDYRIKEIIKNRMIN